MTDAGFSAGPEGGQVVDSNAKSTKEKAREYLERAGMLIPIGLNGYYLYAFCYLIVWHRIRPHDKKAAIAILVIFCWVNLHLIVALVAVHAWGPGRIDEKYLSQSDGDAPFLSNEQGYSLYCSYCQRVKPNRAHHSRMRGTCVPQMDHFCPWLGTVIGQGNLKFFLQYCFSAVSGVIVILVTLFVYQHQQIPYINGNSIALYITGGMTLMATSILAVSHALYVMLSQTTVESLGYSKGRLPYINFLWRNDERRVMQPRKEDVKMPRASPFTQGTWRNIRNAMGPIYTWTLPVRGPIYEPRFNPAFIEMLRKRVDEEELQAASMEKPTTSPENSNDLPTPA